MRPLTDKRMSQIFSEAADLIENTGWTQGRYKRFDPDTRTTCFCAVGAIEAVAPTVLDAIDYEAIEALYTRDDYRPGEIIFYNDTPGRRKQTVVKYLRRKAEEYANR